MNSISSTQSPQPSSNKNERTYAWVETGKVLGKNQKPRSGEIKAKSEEHALHTLRKQGIRQVKLRKLRGQRLLSVPLMIVSAFVRQLSVMIQSGVPLVQALGLINSGLSNKNRRAIGPVIQALRADIESGQKLSEAMRKHPRCFDSLFCNTLAAGEDAGELDSSLNRLATHMEKTLRIQKKIRKAMVYPAMVVIVAIGVTLGMLLFVLPSFKSIYQQFNAELPTLTTLLLATSDFLSKHGGMAALVIGGGIYGLIVLYKRNHTFQQNVDKVLIHSPIFGDLLITAFHARWTRTFATLNASGVPITHALESVAGVARMDSFKKILLDLRQQVATGTRVSDGMEKFKLFPQDSVQMIRIGEESGRLDEMLERLANQYETRLDDKVDNLSTVIEPIIMLVIGGLVAVLIVGMYMPIFNIGNVV